MGLNPGILLKALAEGLSVKLSWASLTKLESYNKM
jgi:hypothetical protein